MILLIIWRRGVGHPSSALDQSQSFLRPLRLPLSTVISPSPSSQSPTIQESWILGSSKDGFLDVEKVLKDPRTTKNPSHLDNGITILPSEDNIVPDEGEEEAIVKDTNNKKPAYKPRVKNDLVIKQLEKNEDFQSVMNYNSHFKPHITKDIYTEGFTVDNKYVCENSVNNDILLTITVISAPDHFQQREAIRKSWGGKHPNVVFMFLVGLADDEAVQEKVMLEGKNNQDIVINKITDLYQNLSLKTLSAFNWITKFCSKSKFLLKVDDDMFVQVDKLIDKIKTILNKNQNQRIILGNISRGWKPVRNPQSKYYITEAQYSDKNYPDFATGPSYLVSQQAVKEIFKAALDQKYIHLEDVFLTGVVAHSLGIIRMDVNEFKNNAVRVPAQFMGCTIQKSFTIHKVEPDEQIELHNLAKNPNCGRPNKKSLALQARKLIKTAINQERHFV